MKTDTVRVGNVPLERVRFHPFNIRKDLGDLRRLTGSIEQYGVMEPVIVENHGSYWRLRAGHRRVAAAKLAGLRKVPALMHSETLEEDEWIIHSVQENVHRRGLNPEERRETVVRLRELGCTWEGIAAAYGVGERTVKGWIASDGARQRQAERSIHSRIQKRPVRDFVEHWRELAHTDATVTVDTVLDALTDLLDHENGSQLAADPRKHQAVA